MPADESMTPEKREILNTALGRVLADAWASFREDVDPHVADKAVLMQIVETSFMGGYLSAYQDLSKSIPTMAEVLEHVVDVRMEEIIREFDAVRATPDDATEH